MSQFSKRSKIHNPYFTKSGVRVSGVTTVLGIIAKPALIHWAWDLGTKGIDYKTYTDELAGVGTLAHSMILDHIQKNETDTSEYPQRSIDLAENAFLSYLEWEKNHDLEPLFMERPLITENVGGCEDCDVSDCEGCIYYCPFGGKPDYAGKINGIPMLMDFKTGKRLYDNHWYQLAGYNLMLAHGYFMDTHEFINYHPKQFVLLNIGRSANEKFEYSKKTDLALDTKIFKAALTIYQTEKKIKKGR